MANDRTDTIRIVHLSDLHIGSNVDVRTWLDPLLADLKDTQGGLGFSRIDGLVISGDISKTADPKEFESALEFVSGLVRAIGISAEHCVIVPGNHDLQWSMPYDWSARRNGDTIGLKKGEFVETPQALARRNADRYEQRFRPFSEFFYHPFFQREYPKRYEEQFSAVMLGDTGVQILGLNSAWEIDELHKERSSIHLGALQRGISALDEQEKEFRDRGQALDQPTLRLGVWHHPVSGAEAIVDSAFLDRLRQSRIHTCAHGHVHESRADLIGYVHARQVHVMGGGSFGAESDSRPESTPRLYNLIEIERDLSNVRVHTRSRRTFGGAWEGWANWPGATPQDRRTFYQVKL